MKESEYYDIIERLGKLVYESVELLCYIGSTKTARRVKGTISITDLAAEADRLAGRLMRAMAYDFITPMGRRELCSIVLSLRRVMNTSVLIPTGTVAECREIADACLRLARTVEKFTGLLRGLKKKKPIPSAAAYFEAARIIKNTASREREVSYALHLYGDLCACCETLILSVMENI